jgi:hypothetical protein
MHIFEVEKKCQVFYGKKFFHSSYLVHQKYNVECNVFKYSMKVRRRVGKDLLVINNDTDILLMKSNWTKLLGMNKMKF